ncbi:MAG: hypothetical protein ACRC3Y_18195, partial [Romboutsia sp.]|uniref:hypothetical protein n=1 Tax=Romboutsia sp. TaxID=1965302 RepID=UPI003F2E7001
MVKNLKVKRYLYIGLIAIALQAIFYLTGYVNKNYNVYIDLTYIYCGTIAIGLSIISILRKNDSFYKYLGISFLGIGLLEYFKIFIKIQGNDKKINVLVDPIISVCIGNLEVIIVLLAIILTLKKVSNTKAVIINIVAFVLNYSYTYIIVKMNLHIIAYFFMCVICIVILPKLFKKNNLGDLQIIGYLLI